MEGHPGPTPRTFPQPSGHEKEAGGGHRKDRTNANVFGLGQQWAVFRHSWVRCTIHNGISSGIVLCVLPLTNQNDN